MLKQVAAREALQGGQARSRPGTHTEIAASWAFCAAQAKASPVNPPSWFCVLDGNVMLNENAPGWRYGGGRVGGYRPHVD